MFRDLVYDWQEAGRLDWESFAEYKNSLLSNQDQEIMKAPNDRDNHINVITFDEKLPPRHWKKVKMKNWIKKTH